MSKKSSEFDRYNRQKKLEREAAVEKRKQSTSKKKSGRPRMLESQYTRGSFRYEDMYEEYEAT